MENLAFEQPDIEKKIIIPPKGKESEIIIEEDSKITFAYDIFLYFSYIYNRNRLINGVSKIWEVYNNLDDIIRETTNLFFKIKNEVYKEIEDISNKTGENVKDCAENVNNEQELLDFNKEFEICSENDRDEALEIYQNARNAQKETRVYKTMYFLRKRSMILMKRRFELDGNATEEIKSIKNQRNDLTQTIISLQDLKRQLEDKKEIKDNGLEEIYEKIRLGLENSLDTVEKIMNLKVKNAVITEAIIEDGSFYDISQALIEKYAEYEYQKALEPLFQLGLTKLTQRQEFLKKKIDEYTPIWLIKHFQKNLNSINKNLVFIVELINNMKLANIRNSNGIIKCLYIEDHPNAYNCVFTAGNYKASFAVSLEEKFMFQILMTLQQNLIKLADSINSIKVTKDFSITYQIPIFLPSPTYPTTLDQIECTDYYSSLFQYSKMLEDCMLVIGSKLQDIQVKGIYAKHVAEFLVIREESNIKIGFSKLFDASLDKPNINFLISVPFEFPFHSDYKNSVAIFKQTTENIMILNEKISLKHKIYKEIDCLEQQLNTETKSKILISENNPTSVSIKNSQKSLVSDDNNLIKIFENIDLWNFAVDHKEFIYLFSILSSRLSFKKSSIFSFKNKPNNRAKITFSTFFKVLNQAIEPDSQINFSNIINSLKNLACQKKITLANVVNFMTSEEIIGSFLDCHDNEQNTEQGIVVEDCYKNWMIICEEMLWLNNMKDKEANEFDKEKMNRLKKRFYFKIEQNEPDCLRKIGKLFDVNEKEKEEEDDDCMYFGFTSL
ncbi:hypothetical protein SteCoe_21128 [Stentor coeruleus]|uniref:Uncharacterized protein n=1 Tax=Stentor coeruleus TaxID=5963 RepID=A0A1R2BQF8_9CILI|nr:hypothetical protein SteCoe_21128 [Stentor coeruleus]